MNLYKLNKTLHRDLGYFFVGMIIIYAVSGIAINHKHDWNPNYIITVNYFGTGEKINKNNVDINLINSIIKLSGKELTYKNHYFPSKDVLRIFVKDGNISVNLQNGDCELETIRSRPFFKEVNFLHYNPGKIWAYFSDIFCIALIFLAISGLFIIKGKYGIIWRGTMLVLAGILIPLIFLLIYL